MLPITPDSPDCYYKSVISSSNGLAEISNTKKPIVQFVYGTVYDFLIGGQGIYKLWPELGIDWKSKGHERLKSCCNAYVFHEAVEQAIGAQTTKYDLLSKFPFLEYASQFVLSHAEAAANMITQQTFICDFPVTNLNADILYILANIGLPNLIWTRLKVTPGINRGGGWYCYPLLAAIAKGNKGSVTALLGLPLSIYNGINITDGLEGNVYLVRSNYMPFSWVCEEGYVAIANLLLERGALVIEADLVRVIENGHIEMAKILLYKGADARAADRKRWIPLHGASRYGHLEIAKILLEKGADPLIVDLSGFTPLRLASENGHPELVQMLLEWRAKDVPTIRADQAARGEVQPLSAVPQTDSGYVSTAANVIRDKDFVADCVDDTSTEYSTTSSMNFLEADTYIEKFARHLAKYTSGLTAEKETQTRISTILPSLLKAFALQVGHQTHTPFSRTVMAFVHMYRGEIADAFRNIQFSQDDEPLPKHSEPSASDDTIDRRSFLDAWIERVESPPAHQEDEQIYQLSPEPASREQSAEQEEVPVNNSPLLFEESAILQTTAFDWLLSRLLKEFHLTPTKPYAMQSIGKSILAALPPARSISRKTLPPTYHVSIELECKLVQFFERQKYSRHPHEVLDGVITLTGSLNDAQAATCGQYLSQTWPSTAPHMIELLRDCLMVKHGCPRTMLYPDGTTLKLRVHTSELKAEVNGVAATVAEIGEQLAWLGAAFRERPEKDGLAYCTPDIITLPNDSPSSQYDLRPSQDVVFRIRFLVEMVEGDRNVNGQCWQSLFKRTIIVKGYPILRRKEWNVGLEANLEILAGLARVDQIHTFDDRFYIKGYSTMLVPTRRSSDIQYWHLIHQTDGGRLSHFATDTVEERYVGSPNDLEQFRHILGWCSQAESFSGLLDSTRTLVTCSMLPKCAKDAVLAGEVYKRGRPIPKTFNFFPVPEDTAPSISSSDLFFRLRLLEAQFVLLWDVKEKRGWLVNGATALLHAVEECVEPDINGDSRSAVLFRGHGSGKTCDNYRRSALQILNDEKYQSIPLYGHGNGHATIKDKVKELCSILEYFIDLQNHAKTNDKLHGKPRKHLEGWDFEDLVSNFRPFHARQTTLERLGKEWVDFIRAIKAVTLFGQGFGDIIRPHRTCQEWTTLPKGRYYVATLISDLHKVLKEHGHCDDGHVRLGDSLIWHSVTPGSGFCKCKGHDQDADKHDRCEPVQTCLPLRLAESLKPGKNRMPDDNEGALIFGHHSQFPWFWGDTGDPEKGQDNEVVWSPRTIEKRILSPDSGIGSSISRSQVEPGDEPSARSEDSFTEPPLKKRKATTHALPPETSSPTNKRKSHVGIICALPDELAAVRAIFDKSLQTYLQLTDDNNCYFTGKIAHHNVVATCLPKQGTGTNNAASTATNMSRSFSPSLCLLVGIGGGVPSEEHDIRLGDVVVGTSIIQYDFGSETEENFQIKDHPLQIPPVSLSNIVNSLCSEQGLIRSSIDNYLAEIIATDGMAQYYRPGHDRDVLYLSCSDCRSVRQPCDHVRGRERRKDPVVEVHYGKIASGNRVIKSAAFRDEIAAKHNVMCFEMEAAGIANTMSYLVVRGISDYCDGNKNDEWYKYASATAAAYAKLLLSKYHCQGKTR
ncbi:hypothetical protein FIE12Z_12589 [Fusarium flagelliforme]|uniref:Nucleoside phosphorylase domain-containing protein n=1 Tax=Fusarium flagelliforme TaxID=2675880 RepID=A0A395M5P9_9HYPO|nr:hypothetical protein FIE12Z_12589 [Fusarium flagelliforme]